MKNFFIPKYKKMISYIKGHKTQSGVALIVIIILAYWGFSSINNTSGETRYVTSTVQKGTIITTVTGTGQVSTSNQIELSPKASGDVVYIGVTNGQSVKAGTLIAELDTTDAEKSIRDAEVNLQSAKIAYQKLIAPADTLSLIQAEDAVSGAVTSLATSYDDGFGSVSDTFLDLPTIMTGLNDVLNGSTVNKGQDNLSAYTDIVQNLTPNGDLTVVAFKNDATQKYQTALSDYNQSLLDFQKVTRSSSTTTIETLINSTYKTVKSISESIKSSNDFLNYVKNSLTTQNKTIPAILTTHQASLGTYTSQVNGHLTALLNSINTISSSEYSLSEKNASLSQLKSGALPLDIQSSQLNVTKSQNSLQDAQDALSDYYVRAPFDGVVAKLNVIKGDSASSGTSVATFITSQKIAEISLNEVDVAKVSVGQKVNLTFDAVDGLSISGSVAEIDTVGTVSQGVVTYNVKIGFDTQDNRIKSGMSVSAAIITNVKQDVLIVPNSAIKTSGTTSYVEMFVPPIAQSTGNSGTPSLTPPIQQVIQTGLSDDTNTEIVSGLKEGDQIVTRTITSTTKTTTTPSLLGGGSGGRVGGVRIGG